MEKLNTQHQRKSIAKHRRIFTNFHYSPIYSLHEYLIYLYSSTHIYMISFLFFSSLFFYKLSTPINALAENLKMKMHAIDAEFQKWRVQRDDKWVIFVGFVFGLNVGFWNEGLYPFHKIIDHKALIKNQDKF